MFSIIYQDAHSIKYSLKHQSCCTKCFKGKTFFKIFLIFYVQDFVRYTYKNRRKKEDERPSHNIHKTEKPS